MNAGNFWISSRTTHALVSTKLKYVVKEALAFFYGVPLLFEYVVIHEVHLLAHCKHGSAVGIRARMEQSSAKKYSWYYSLWARL